MKWHRLQLICIALTTVITPQVEGQHYYGGGQEISLIVDSSKVTIKFDSDLGGDGEQSLLAQIDRIVNVYIDNHAIDGFKICSLSTDENCFEFVDSVASLEGVYLVEPFYKNEFDSVSLVGTRFCVAFNQTNNDSQIDSINSTYNVVIDHELEYMPNVFVLRNTDSSGYGLLEIANTYYELTETYYSHPEFGVWIQANSYKLFDYFNSFQPHIKKVIGNFNSAVVWDFAKVLNDSIIVAVIDYGVESHEDLPASRLRPGFDYAQGDNNPTPGQFQGHGMATAGIIAASHTIDSIAGLQASTGVISLNPKVSVLPLKIFNDNGTSTGVFPSEIAQAISFAWKNGAAILSNSWGYGSPCPVPSIYDVLTSAIDSAAAFGRGGKGCPVIFSSGNGGIQTLGVQYPACLPSALSVGALQLSVSIPQVNDYRWSYSQYGSALDLMAPSSSLCLVGTVWTLDRMGTVGYNPGVTQLPNCPSITTWDCPSAGSNDVDYMCQFGGTSGACPIVSGIASLVLSKDPTLTRQQVYNILDSSAVTQLDWGPLPDTPHVEYGYGRVDAFRAILSISRGDLNNDGTIGNVLDLTILVDWIFRGIPPPNFPSPKLGDCNCDGTANNILDLTRLVDWLFRSGPPPVNPCFKF